jgi:ubiquinone/menaquinone biosynthesis C-methylase UbiE/uncharacterized protein YbaR (Trm112 family)
MKRSTVELLTCPNCHTKLSLQESVGSTLVETGFLSCFACQKKYPITDGIVNFISYNTLDGFNKTFAHLYDWFSLVYPEFSKIGFRLLGTTDAKARRDLMRRLEPEGSRVLEVSIGPGVNLPYLFELPGVKEVFGLDISSGQLKRCRSMLRRNSLSVDLFLGNGEQLPFADDVFDSVFHIGGINFFTNKQSAINEMIRVAKPGTKLMICDENEIGARWYEKFLPGFKSAFNGPRQSVTAPIDLIPSSMTDLKFENLWNGYMYYLEFRKPYRPE